MAFLHVFDFTIIFLNCLQSCLKFQKPRPCLEWRVSVSAGFSFLNEKVFLVILISGWGQTAKNFHRQTESFGQLAKYLESKYALTGMGCERNICSVLPFGVDGYPQVGNVNVCPKSVGVSAMSSCPEHFSHWVGTSGIPQLPYKNVDVSQIF